MKSCPDCGTENSDLSGFCFKRSAELPRALNISSAPIAPHTEKRQPSDAEPSDTEKPIKRTESRLSDISSQMLSHRCGLAASLSALLPGLGHVYGEDIIRGIAMVAGWVISGFFYRRWVIRSIGARSELYPWATSWDGPDLGFGHLLIGLMLIGFWIYAVVDAASAPERVR